MSSFLYSIWARSQSFAGADQLGIGVFDGGFRVLNFLRPRAVLQLGQAGFGGIEVGAALLDIGGQSLPLPAHGGLRLRQLRFAESKRCLALLALRGRADRDRGAR